MAHEDRRGLTYADESVDTALRSDSLEHVLDVDLTLSEVRRVLKPGRASIFSVPIIRLASSTV